MAPYFELTKRTPSDRFWGIKATSVTYLQGAI